MKTLIAILALLALTAPAQRYRNLTRIGGGVGGGSSETREIKKQAAKTAENPIRKRMTAGAFKKQCVPQLISMYGIQEDGVLLRKKKFLSMGDSISTTETARPNRVRVIQSVGNGVCLASSKSIRDGSTFAVRLGQVVADDSECNLYLKDNGELFSYKTVLGAQKNVAFYDYVPVPPDAKEQQLVDAFVKGQNFEVILPCDYKCPTCNGRGTVPKKKGTFTIRKKCSTCKGTCKIQLPTLYIVAIK